MTMEIQLTQGQVALVDDADYEWLSQFKWTAAKCNRKGPTKFRAVRGGGRRSLVKRISMHQQIMEAPKGLTVDHINGDPLDSRRSNLRICTQAEQTLNRAINAVGKTADGKRTSRFKGVYWSKSINRWVSRFMNKHLCCTTDEVEAARAYDAAALAHSPEFARVNFPADGGASCHS